MNYNKSENRLINEDTMIFKKDKSVWKRLKHDGVRVQFMHYGIRVCRSLNALIKQLWK